MKKIIHLSDLHVGSPELLREFDFLVTKLINLIKADTPNYIIVITGDLADNANFPENFAKVKDGLDQLKNAGFADILIIPGNHDYGTGTKGDKKFIEIFQHLFHSPPHGYPRKTIIDDVAFIGLDSMAEELHWYDKLWAEGELGTVQLTRLKNMLKETDVRSAKKRVIYLHHHPFDARPLHQLKDAKKFQSVLISAIEQGITIDALLYGHNHQGNSCNGEWGIKRCYDGGSSTLKRRPKAVDKMPWYQVKDSIRVIDLENDDADKDYQILKLYKNE